MARPSHLSLRLSPEERARFLALSSLRGISLAEWVRDAANRRAEIEETKIEAARVGIELDDMEHVYFKGRS